MAVCRLGPLEKAKVSRGSQPPHPAAVDFREKTVLHPLLNVWVFPF